MPELVLSAAHVTALQDHLLQADGRERFAYVFCTESGDDRLLAADVRPVPDEELRVQGQTRVGPTQAYERAELERCLSRGYQPMEVHSHPFSDHAGFSGIDMEMMADHTAWLHALEPDADVAFAVLGQEAFEATVYDAETEYFRDLPFTVIGDWTLDTPVATTDEATSVDTQLWDRAIRLVGEAGQRRLAATTVGVVGAGGLGFELVEKLARLGVQKLVVIDHDHVEYSNLNRLAGTSTYDVGRPKVTVLAQQLHETGLEIEVKAVPERVEDATEALAECDVIFGTVDQVSTRSFLNQYAVTHLRYYIDAGSIIRTEDEQVTDVAGIVQLVAPGVNGCYACIDRSDPERARREQLTDEELQADVDAGYIEEAVLTPEPAVGTLNGVIASLAASVFTQLVAGYASPPDMVRYEELDWDFIEITTRRDPQCPTCGDDDGLLGEGDREISDAELADLAPADSESDRQVVGDGAGVPAPSDGATHRLGVVEHLRTLLRRVVR